MQIAINSSLFSLEIAAPYFRLGSVEMFVRSVSPRARGAWFDLTHGEDKTIGLAWWDVTINRVPEADGGLALDAWELSESGPLRAPSEHLSECLGEELSDAPSDSDTPFGH